MPPRAENDWAYDYLPRLSGPHGTYQTVTDMLADEVEGYFLLGQNPAVGSANGRMQRMGMSHLKWLVVRDLNLIESATWWKDGPEIASGELRTEDIATEVFFLPAATHVEKAGSFTQTQRLLQWREKAVDPPGQCQSELDFFYELGQADPPEADRLDRRAGPAAAGPDLGLPGPTSTANPTRSRCWREINGYHLQRTDAGKPVVQLHRTARRRLDRRPAAGSTPGCTPTASTRPPTGCRTAATTPASPSGAGPGRPTGGSCTTGRPPTRTASRGASARRYVWWDEEQGRWVGDDVPDFVVDRAPGSRPDPDVGGPAALAGDDPFVMQADGKGWLFAPKGMVDGPLPTHYEPQESPVANALYPQQQSPARILFPRKDNLWAPSAGEPGADVYPYVFTTYRLTEHHTAGGMSRWLPYLAELQPEMFCEVSPELGRRGRVGELRLGHDHLAAHGDRGQGAGHRPDDAVGHRRPHRSTRSVCPITGVSAGTRWSAATPPTTCSASPWIRTCRSRSPRPAPATSGPAADRRARSCCGWSPSTSPASGTTVETDNVLDHRPGPGDRRAAVREPRTTDRSRDEAVADGEQADRRLSRLRRSRGGRG